MRMLLLTATSTISFGSSNVAEGEACEVIVSVDNPESIPIGGIKVVDPAGNEHIVDPIALKLTVNSTDVNVHDGNWSVMIEADASYPFTASSDEEELNVFRAREYVFVWSRGSEMLVVVGK